jgi:hypothetical protein
MKHISEEQLVMYYYREDADALRSEIAAHLASCAACRASYASLESMLAGVASVPLPERSTAYGAEVWRRIRPHLADRAPAWWAGWLQPRRWALAGGLAAALVVAFLAGRHWSPQPPPPAVAVSPQVRERILLVAVGDHLDRSQMLLVELINTDGEGTVNIAPEKQWARDLVASNRLYRQTALENGQPGMANVLDELERVLVEIANSPSDISAARLERIRRRIESQGILFKVRVIGSQVREREMRAARETGGKTL